MFCPHFAGGILPLHRSDIPGKKTVGMAYILIVFNKHYYLTSSGAVLK